jgi:hypothetical protein
MVGDKFATQELGQVKTKRAVLFEEGGQGAGEDEEGGAYCEDIGGLVGGAGE